MVDFKKLRTNKTKPVVVNPIEIFRRLPKPEGINDLYTSQAEVKDFLEAAWPALVKYFGKPVEVVLEMLTDPDQSNSAQLVGWIQWTSDVNEWLARLDRFDEEWFLDHLAEVDNKFNFNLETN